MQQQIPCPVTAWGDNVPSNTIPSSVNAPSVTSLFGGSGLTNNTNNMFGNTGTNNTPSFATMAGGLSFSKGKK